MKNNENLFIPKMKRGFTLETKLALLGIKRFVETIFSGYTPGSTFFLTKFVVKKIPFIYKKFIAITDLFSEVIYISIVTALKHL